ncbi:MAG: DinB family protein [Acidobacteria bacterium]|nr:DinB family protein [Acidobacteriota bacterium]
MAELLETVNAGFANYYEKLRVDLHTWVASLSEEQFWKNPFPYGNSVGHLVLHLTGNLNYYVGAQIAETGYVRDRPREFAETKVPSKLEALAEFDKAVEMVKATVRKQSAEDWIAPYSGTGVTCENRFAIVLDCAAHADHHIGQILNLARELVR